MADSEAELTIVMRARNLASREVDRLHGSLGRAAGGVKRLGGAFELLGKVGILAVITAIAAAIGFIGKATGAALEEQKGIARLNAALKANVKGWKGNTDAIEATIAKREKLAFSDDELRSSLTTLVAKYKNVDKAQQLQLRAMDLARLKNISLDDATAMLTKGLDGNQKILKSLGITLPKTASEHDRLIAIQKVAKGQADKFGKSEAGAMQAAQIAMGDLVEDIGSAFLPIVGQMARFIVNDVIPAIRRVVGRIQDWLDKNKPIVDAVKKFVADALAKFVDALKAVLDFIGKVIDAVSKFVDGIKKNKPLMKGLTDLWNGLGKAIGIIVDALKWIIDNADKALKALGPLVTEHTVSEHVQHHTGVNPDGSATGGWVGLNGPEIRKVGETGPEYVTPRHALGASGVGGGGTIILQISGKEVARAIVPEASRQMYYELTRASATRSPA